MAGLRSAPRRHKLRQVHTLQDHHNYRLLVDIQSRHDPVNRLNRSLFYGKPVKDDSLEPRSRASYTCLGRSPRPIVAVLPASSAKHIHGIDPVLHRPPTPVHVGCQRRSRALRSDADVQVDSRRQCGPNRTCTVLAPPTPAMGGVAGTRSCWWALSVFMPRPASTALFCAPRRMVRPRGFEPLTFCSGGKRSIRTELRARSTYCSRATDQEAFFEGLFVAAGFAVAAAGSFNKLSIVFLMKVSVAVFESPRGRL